MSHIPHFDLGGNGKPLHFLHANGYPPECYTPLFEHLKKHHHIFGMKLRPLWGNALKEELPNWHPYSEDLQRFLSDFGPNPVIGVGHSIGGIVTLRAAMRAPHKFQAVVLLDPVFFAPPILAGWRLIHAVGLGEKLHPLVPAAKRRRREFKDLDVVFRSYRSKPVFRYLSDEGLKTYISGITQPKADGNGYELVYSPEWETHIYLTGLQDFDLWRGLYTFNIPTLIIRGEETDTFLPSAAQLVKKKNSTIQIHTLPKATHILPLEHPQKVAQLIQDFLTTL